MGSTLLRTGSHGPWVPPAMLRLQSLGVAAVLLAAAAGLAPAQAASQPAASASDPQLAIREVQLDAPSTPGLQPQQLPASPAQTQLASLSLAPLPAMVSTGQASWYGPGFFGNRTASGEVLRPGSLTAAHRTLPFGTLVRVTNLWNGRTAVVRINDRGPFHHHRVIDLAHGAARQLGLTASGVARVRLEVLR